MHVGRGRERVNERGGCRTMGERERGGEGGSKGIFWFCSGDALCRLLRVAVALVGGLLKQPPCLVLVVANALRRHVPAPRRATVTVAEREGEQHGEDMYHQGGGGL